MFVLVKNGGGYGEVEGRRQWKAEPHSDPQIFHHPVLGVSDFLVRTAGEGPFAGGTHAAGANAGAGRLTPTMADGRWMVWLGTGLSVMCWKGPPAGVCVLPQVDTCVCNEQHRRPAFSFHVTGGYRPCHSHRLWSLCSRFRVCVPCSRRSSSPSLGGSVTESGSTGLCVGDRWSADPPLD